MTAAKLHFQYKQPINMMLVSSHSIVEANQVKCVRNLRSYSTCVNVIVNTVSFHCILIRKNATTSSKFMSSNHYKLELGDDEDKCKYTNT